jgi:leader peptidase (prepilin peptidase)/N-methyltransferase
MVRGGDTVSALVVVWMVAFSAALGSFVAASADRLAAAPAGGLAEWRALLGRSRCEHCARTLHWRELVPVLSYLGQRGRCRCGSTRLPWRLLAFELAPAAAALAAGWRGLPVVAALAVGALVALGAAIARTDTRYGVVPDTLTFMLAVAGIVFAATAPPVGATAFTALASGLAAAIGLGAGLGLVAWLYRRGRGADGLGGGDVKLAAAGGLWVGAAQAPLFLALAAVAGLAQAVLSGRTRSGASLPFAPALMAALVLVVALSLR